MSVVDRYITLNVERGLSSLAYCACPIGSTATPIAIQIVDASPGVSLLPAPGEPFGVLSAPGRIMIVVASEPGTLKLDLGAASDDVSALPQVELKCLDAQQPSPIVPEIRLRPDLPEGGVEFLLRAHVSLRGDLAAPRGHWICGPDAPGRIEGLELRGVASDLPLEYQVATAGRSAGWSNWTPAGTYAGSRGKALPLIGLRVRLLPSAATDLLLRADGVFLGASVVTRRGREIELVGPTPLDPLVGVRLDFAKASEMPATVEPVPPVRQPSRLRIFRRSQRDVDIAA